VTPPQKRILVVEDQRLIAADIEATLVRIGYEVVGSVASGEEAVTEALRLRPDLILMDIRLRGAMDGIEAAARIRELLDIPVVFLTAYADEPTVLRAKGTAPFGYVLKPFNERELRATVEVALYKHESDRLLAEERAQRSAAEQVQLLVQELREHAILLLDPDGHILTWNQGAVLIEGYEAPEVLGKHLAVLYPPNGSGEEGAEALLARAREEGRAEIEGWRRRKDGTAFWASSLLTRLNNGGGAVRGYAHVIQDLTERRRQFEQAQDAIRARDEFLQIAAHELRTPLTPLTLQIEMIEKLVQETPELGRTLGSKIALAKRQALRLGGLVESLLDVSRITSGRIALEPESLDLTALVGELASRFTSEATRAGSTLEVRARGPAWGQWDRLRVEQILSNLISNAIKYGMGKPITVDVSEKDGRVHVAVTDRGIGIEEEALQRIFRRLERAASARYFGGLGLGLFIARELAEAHGGSLAATSRPGSGSTFTLCLPLPEARRLG
jgi:PAS domain S-box-containing protein